MVGESRADVRRVKKLAERLGLIVRVEGAGWLLEKQGNERWSRILVAGEAKPGQQVAAIPKFRRVCSLSDIEEVLRAEMGWE